MLFILIIFLLGLFLGSKFQPGFSAHNNTVTFHYSSGRGSRNKKDLFKF